MMKKLSILLLVLCLLLPAAAMAEEPYVTIDEVELPDGYYMASGTNVPVAEKPEGGYAYLKDGVLTLYNYTLTSDEYQTIWVRYAALEIKLLGNNSLKNTSAAGDAIALQRNASLTVSGSGSLHIDAPYGIYGYYASEKVLLTGGKVTIEASKAGIICGHVLTISGGELTATHSAFAGIDAKNLSITGGKVTVSIPGDIGIAADAVTVTGGTTTVNAKCYGIRSHGTLCISGADTIIDLTCTGKEAESLALCAYVNPRIDSPLEIMEPEGGVIGYHEGLGTYTVLNTDSTLPQHVRIAAPAPVVTPVPTVPATGDHADLALWLALAVLTMTGAVLIRKRAYR